MEEFIVAFHHNVMVKRNKRLIVLMALDRPTDLYDNDASDKAALRQYLRHYTYIDYRADDWLDRLLYALPLRGLYTLQNIDAAVNHAMLGDEENGGLQEMDALLLNRFEDEHQPNPNYGL